MLLTALLWTNCSDEKSDELMPNDGAQIEISDTSKSPNFSTEGGQTSIEFTAKNNWTASVSNTRADNWCTIHPLSGKAGKVTLTVTTTVNETYDERNAVITIRSGADKHTLTVIQKQKNALIIGTNKVEMKKEGGELILEVKSNINFTSSIEEGIDWITAANNTRGLVDTALKFNIAPNSSGYKRQADIIVTDGTLNEHVTVYQEGDTPQLVVTASGLSFDHTGDSLKIEVNSNIDYEMTLPETDWITEDKERNQSTHTLYFYVNPNDTYAPRSTNILFKDKHSELADMVKITQLQKNALVFSDNMIRVPSNENRLKIKFRRNIDFKIAVNTNWITQVENPEPRALKTDSVYFVILANPQYEERSCHITFSSMDGKVEQKITVIQEKREIDETEEEKELRKTLVKIFRECDGENWSEDYRGNWNTVLPVNRWYGVKRLADGTFHVTLDGRYTKNKLEMSNCRPISILTIDAHNFEGIDASTLMKLQSINISNCPNLNSLYFIGAKYNEDPELLSKLQEININNCPLLENLFCNGNIINKLLLTKCPRLNFIQCSYNHLKTLDLTECPDLEGLDCSFNKFAELRITNHNKIKGISIDNNKALTTLDLKGCNSLESLSCYDCQLSNLNLEGCGSIEYIHCSNNLLTSLSIDSPKLSKLYCSHNKFDQLNITGTLKEVNCDSIPSLTSLTLNSSTTLDYLTCDGNPLLNTLNINADVKNLNCRSAALTTLDLTQCISLDELYCNDNPYLRTLNIDNCRKLRLLNCKTTIISGILPEWLLKATLIIHAKYQYITEYDNYFNGIDTYKVKKQDYGWYRKGEPDNFPDITLNINSGVLILPDGSQNYHSNWISKGGIR